MKEGLAKGEGRVPVKAVLFDNDGTLIDSYDLILHSMRYATREVLGVEISDERLMSMVGTPLRDQMIDFSPEHAEELLVVYRQLNHELHDTMTKEFPGVRAMLEGLSELGMRMGVVTSKLHKLAMRGLGLFDYQDFFEFLIGPDDCEGAKPDPAPILFAVDKLGLSPEECVYVGDSPFDIQAGNAAGCTTIAAQWGMFSSEVLHAENPTYEAAAPADVLRIVKTLI